MTNKPMDDLVERLQAWGDLDTEHGHNSRADVLHRAAVRITALEASLAEAEGRVIAARRQAFEEAAKVAESASERSWPPPSDIGASIAQGIRNLVKTRERADVVAVYKEMIAALPNTFSYLAGKDGDSAQPPPVS